MSEPATALPRLGTTLARLAGLATFAAAVAAPLSMAAAHPHVFVVATATINIDHDAITSITHTWTFDEMYAAMALDGVAKNKDGGYGRAELAELAKVNIEGLKEFDYFTFASVGKTPLKVGDPKPDDYYLDYVDNVLALHFTVPLAQPVPIAGASFSLVVSDPSYFIAFDIDEKHPPRLSDGAPNTCKLAVEEPKEDQTDDQKRLSGAFSEQMSQIPLSMGGIVKQIRVECAK